LTLKKYRVAVFVHGCFWHQHHGCRFAYQPASNAMFWRTKLRGNAKRDRLIEQALLRQDWRVLIIWECALRAKPEALKRLQERVSRWIMSRRRRRVFPMTPGS
jgi:DNA mismatch endonuclease (patch repair protein)